MNLTQSLQAVDLTTLARVTEFSAQGGTSTATAGWNTFVTRLITDVSSRITEYLGFHTLEAARTETYELSVNDRQLTLDGRPIKAADPFTLRIGTSPEDSELNLLTAEDAANYRVHHAAGYVRLNKTTRIAGTTLINYARVTYTGGLADTAANVIANHPWAAHAAEMQIKYLLGRINSLGGNVKVGQTSTDYVGPYMLQDEVREILDGKRRRYA